jgi:hypothetical protein
MLRLSRRSHSAALPPTTTPHFPLAHVITLVFLSTRRRMAWGGLLNVRMA